MTALPLFIGGRFRVGEGRTVEPVVDPATGGGVADPTHAGARELDEAALDRMASKGLKPWIAKSFRAYGSVAGW